MPNSLIFAVILAVWAAYLIQHWIRRRDHVATAKSVDRFSEAMRVLERRRSMPRADISTPRPRSYSLTLTRPTHPDVVVKRARPAAPTSRRRTSRWSLPQWTVTQQRGAALAAGALALLLGLGLSITAVLSWWAALVGVAAALLALTFVRFSVGAEQRRATSPLRGRSARPKAPRSASSRPTASRAGTPPSGVGRSGSPRRPAAPRLAGDRRQSTAGSAPGRRPTASRPTGRRAATPRPATARAGATAPQVPEQHAPAPAQTTVPAPPRTPQQSAGHAADRGHTSGGSADRGRAHRGSADRGRAHRGSELYDLEAVEAAQQARGETSQAAPVSATQSAATQPAELAPGTWAPVPVPPPTYTLKARAPRREVSTQPSATRVDDLPFDGHALALEEEFEDLPPVHSVG